VGETPPKPLRGENNLRKYGKNTVPTGTYAEYLYIIITIKKIIKHSKHLLISFLKHT